MNIFRILGTTFEEARACSSIHWALYVEADMRLNNSGSVPPHLHPHTASENEIFTYIFWTLTTGSLYNTTFKLLFLSAQSYTLYLMLTDYRPTHDPNIDTFKVQYLLAASAVLGILFPYRYELAEMLWAFSIWLESVAILPQLFMLQRTGEAETITTHYLFALGVYRALYIPNWLWRYFGEGYVDPIPWVAGVVQTVLYSDFFWVYYTKVLQGKKFNLPV
ncbi:MAG: endoplasmic reticulum retention protein [Ramalina farinacea]|uniref:ER lumen protein-retaining receptor n=1 Tax=Ramalina farinacea TaxID=258253 RepID=A0AA43TRZ5_9LECA|nr:endoplasmic reticulum retention protein [Ramalina farinacea]